MLTASTLTPYVKLSENLILNFSWYSYPVAPDTPYSCTIRNAKNNWAICIYSDRTIKAKCNPHFRNSFITAITDFIKNENTVNELYDKMRSITETFLEQIDPNWNNRPLIKKGDVIEGMHSIYEYSRCTADTVDSKIAISDETVNSPFGCYIVEYGNEETLKAADKIILELNEKVANYRRYFFISDTDFPDSCNHFCAPLKINSNSPWRISQLMDYYESACEYILNICEYSRVD